MRAVENNILLTFTSQNLYLVLDLRFKQRNLSLPGNIISKLIPEIMAHT
jgi:hypothetical protein